MTDCINIFRNRKLFEIYQLYPNSLYTLHKQNYPNQHLQQEYNMLPDKYKYNSIMEKGLPTCLKMLIYFERLRHS